MRILTWNCKGAYRNKHQQLIETYDPDIWMVQECESPEKLKKNKCYSHYGDMKWFGDNPNKGVGFFSKDPFVVDFEPFHNPKFRYVIPVHVSGDHAFRMFVVWAMDDKEDRKQRYIGQVYRALDHYDQYLGATDFVLGDFNWNASFSISSPLYGDFQGVIDKLEEKHFFSAYHMLKGEPFGKETEATLFFRCKQNSRYHIDYIFVKGFPKETSILSVGEWDKWHLMSDHMPVVLDVEISR